jgi:hypothetical protein
MTAFHVPTRFFSMVGATHSSDLELQPINKTAIMKKAARCLNINKWLNEMNY